MPEVSKEQLLRWAAALTLADSYMSLVFYRLGIVEWDTASTPSERDWRRAMGKARTASVEVKAMLQTEGIDGHAIAREMDS
jgi:hypothetical protein